MNRQPDKPDRLSECAGLSVAGSGWLMLSGQSAPARLPDRLDRGRLSIELSWPLPQDVLLDWQAGEQTLSLFHHPRTGLALLWREGECALRLRLAAPLPCTTRAARLDLSWEAGAWSLRLEDAAGREIARARPPRGQPPAGLPGAALAALCRGDGIRRRDLSVLWFGLSDGVLPARSPWIGRATPIDTPAGPVAAGALQTGDWIFTRDAGPVRLRGVRHFEMPSRGSHAAVILRAPWFARRADLLVSADQMIALRGSEIEYLFDSEEIVVAAGSLIDGKAALADQRRDTTPCLALDTGGPHLIEADGCCLMATGPAEAPARVLEDYEALSLLSALARMRP
ncbi:Hint domain-containing protein [Pseudogemmobacter humi]|uniref:Hedgehog/Intein (Hint) domain-containing protein n=1 Tax=Pseudogemmobacter humi TaxID=2483812 RepID=A0A3P5X4U7_9RHOB|nr:Hint domain-containing protein [Pseudogemmobacter humi]VDC23257.1 hypothetical protein XINFAN_00951 [Pseudogemmobacter humi]